MIRPRPTLNDGLERVLLGGGVSVRFDNVPRCADCDEIIVGRSWPAIDGKLYCRAHNAERRREST